jgi:Ca2+/Na+ antiporter
VVDVISELGDETSIPPFYISFVVTPMCSNASELISSLIFAARKTEENASVTFSQLFGAVCMNNTMGLGALTGLIYFRDLTWEFSAEVMCILVTIIVVSIMTMRRSYKTWFIFPIAFLYVFAIALVAFLENVVNWT